MNPTICQCCGGIISEKGGAADANPNICASCDLPFEGELKRTNESGELLPLWNRTTGTDGRAQLNPKRQATLD